MLEFLKVPKRFRSWDSMMCNYIHKNFKYDGVWDNRTSDNIFKTKWNKSYIIPNFYLHGILRNEEIKKK